MEMIHERRHTERKEEQYDLFSSLLDASQEESDGRLQLTDRELIGMYPYRLFIELSYPPAGNVFIFLLAGSQNCVYHPLFFMLRC